MKKTIVIILSVLFPIRLFAAWGDEGLIGRSSFTRTNDTLVSLSTGSDFTAISTSTNYSILQGGMFDGIVIDSPSAGGSITFYNSVGVNASTICVLNLNTSGGPSYIPFFVRISSGITYTTTGNTGGVNILYRILQPVTGN